MTAYLITAALMIAMYFLGYAKGKIDANKEKIEFVSNYGDNKK